VTISPAVRSAVLNLARRQNGLISRRQAIKLGVTDRQLAGLVASGVVVRLHHGILALAGTHRDHATDAAAAILLFGPDVVASHASAAWLQGLIKKPPASVHVTVPRSCRHRIRGVDCHQSLVPVARRPFNGIMCTDPVRTLIDLAACATADQLAAAVDQALAHRLVRLSDLDVATRGTGRRRGRAHLRRCLLDRGLVGAPTPSVLESRFLRDCRRFGLPFPQAEVVAGEQGQYRLDFAYPLIRLAIEVYGYAWHHTPEQLGSDLARQRHLTEQGWTVLAFTWKQLADDPEGVIREILAAYSRLSLAA
jgi:hypothetical protein